MKQILYTLMGLSVLLTCGKPSVEKVSHTRSAKQAGAAFDSTLAADLGADDYGMHPYVMAFLKAGPNRNQDSTTAAALQKAHLDNIGLMAKQGKLVLAGPFLDDGALRGIYVFDVESVGEAEKLTATDPAIRAGRLVMELHPWYGPASLKEVNKIQLRLQKKTF